MAQKKLVLMKALISHDIDHITATEHLWRDLIVPKFIVRSKIEWLSGKISGREFLQRFSEIWRNKWHYSLELAAFNQSAGVPSTFFVATARGKGLQYSHALAASLVHQLKYLNCHIGLHGMHFQSDPLLQREKQLLAEMLGYAPRGIRMHYLRQSAETLTLLNALNFEFDTSEYGFKKPYRIGRMWEIPFQIMDVHMLCGTARWQSRSLKQACDATREVIHKAHEAGLPYLGIDFHDRYYSAAFASWMKWYEWLIYYLAQQKIPFVSFEQVLDELNENAP